MRSRQILSILFFILLLVTGCLIVIHSVRLTSVAEIQHVPIYIMVLCIVYVIGQLLKRYIVKSYQWWDWIYYIGLLAVMLPPYVISADNQDMYLPFAQYGTICLILPVLLDGTQLVKKKKEII